MLDVPVDGKFRFTRQGSVSNTDLKTMDFGNLWISTIYGDGTVVGELYVEFEVELQKPTARSNVSCTLVASGSSPTTLLSSNSITGPAAPVSVASTSTLQFTAAGEYFFTIAATGTTMTGFALPSLSATGSGVIKSIFAQRINSAGTLGSYAFAVRADVGDVLTLSSLVSAATLSSVYMYINECDYASMF